jgi:hypothetical protein
LAGYSSDAASLQDVANGCLLDLQRRLPAKLHPHGPNLCSKGHEGAGEAGVDVTVTARHADRHNLCWMVAIWMDRAAGDSWYATVKGETDLDDDDGGDFCVLNEQHAVAEANETAEAVRVLSAMVANCPLTGLLAKRWSHGHHDVGHGSEAHSPQSHAPSQWCASSRSPASQVAFVDRKLGGPQTPLVYERRDG